MDDAGGMCLYIALNSLARLEFFSLLASYNNSKSNSYLKIISGRLSRLVQACWIVTDLVGAQAAAPKRNSVQCQSVS